MTDEEGKLVIATYTLVGKSNGTFWIWVFADDEQVAEIGPFSTKEEVHAAYEDLLQLNRDRGAVDIDRRKFH